MSAATGRTSQVGQAPQVGQVLAERYELKRFLGAGAMGAVYEAATPTNERVAVKVLLEMEQSAMAEEVSKRFLREALIASTIGNKHIVPVIDSGIDAALQIPYLVMPLLSGFDLEVLLDRVGALHPTVAARIIVQACSALTEAHTQGVIHRDIKPGNIFLDHQTDGSVVVRLLDFGIAKQEDDQQLTRVGTVMGTPHYMAPEQLRDSKQVDGRSDVWGIAATLYHALSGFTPFDEAVNMTDLQIAMFRKDVPAIQDRASWIDPGLATVVHGALLRDLAARCPSADEFRSTLLPFIQKTPDLDVSMLEPLPRVLRRVRARRAERITEWQRSTPSQALPPMQETTPDVLLGRKLGGEYRLLRRLGRGNAGGLYEALASDGNRFAARVLDPRVAGTDKAARRFVREARALAVIDNPHVVQPIDTGYDEELAQPYIVVELLRGMDLAEHLDRVGPLRPTIAVALLLQLCQGIQAAHSHDFIHRDICPANAFLVERPGGEALVTLTGFAMIKQLPNESRANPRDLTLGSDVIGSMYHTSPEQAGNPRDADKRSDVFSAAATLFHALAGEPPWPADLTSADLLMAVAGRSPTHLQDVAPWVSRALTEVVHRGLKRDPDERWQSIEVFLAALKKITHAERITWTLMDGLSSSTKARKAPRAEAVEPSMVRPPPKDSAPTPPASASPASASPAAPSTPSRPTAAAATAHHIEDEATAAEPTLERRAQAAQRTRTLLAVALVLVVLVAAAAGYLLTSG